MAQYFKSMANPTGVEDPTLCVHTREWPVQHIRPCPKRQCSRKRGHGPAGVYCKQHSNIVARKLEPRSE